MRRYWSAPLHGEYSAHPYSARDHYTNRPHLHHQSHGPSLLGIYPPSISIQSDGRPYFGTHQQSNSYGRHCAAPRDQPWNGTRNHYNLPNNPWQRNYTQDISEYYKNAYNNERVASNNFRMYTEETTRVTLKKLPFFDVISTLLEVDISNQGMPVAHYKFTITADKANYFKDKRSTNPYQIQLRVCKPDCTSEQTDYFPSLLQIAVNDIVCKLPGMQMVPRGPAGPVEITDKCNLYINKENKITIKRPPEKLKLFVQCVKKITAQDLIQQLKAKTTVIPEVTASKIKDKLKGDSSGDEIASTTLHCSLLCPLGKTRMTLPCRASTCSHFQCFDAVVYLQMNECKQKWLCPVCFQPAIYDHLQVDGYFTSILEQNSSSDKIILLADGSWQPVSAADNRQQQPPIENICDDYQAKDTQCAPHNITVDLDSEEDTINYDSAENLQEEVFSDSLDVNMSNAGTDAQAAVETITLSDDESLINNSHTSDPGFRFSSTPRRQSMRTRRSTSLTYQSPDNTGTTQFTSSTPLHSTGRTLGDFLAVPELRRSKRNTRSKASSRANSIMNSTDNGGNGNMENNLTNSEISRMDRNTSASTISRMDRNTSASTISRMDRNTSDSTISGKDNTNTSQKSMASGSVCSDSSDVINLTEDDTDSFFSGSDNSAASFIPLRLSGACASSRRATQTTDKDHCRTHYMTGMAPHSNSKKQKQWMRKRKRPRRNLKHSKNKKVCKRP
nr:E3 SUMO-protein ligase PIAS1-like isoform X2 [Procambarus clarkii]